MKLFDILLLLKGKRAAVGEIRNWKGGSYIKTATGWKPHEKQYSKKYVERKNNAAGKKESDLKHRQSEVARLSGEIQGHKAAVEHHSQSGDKNDVRQAKHHAIRAQVKGRRLEKHKQILAERHGVKDEPIKEPAKSYEQVKEEEKAFKNKKKESIKFLKEKFSNQKKENNTEIDNEQTDKLIQTLSKVTPYIPPSSPTKLIDIGQAKANFEKWKADRQEEKPKEPEPPKTDLIQSGNRGATIAGQQYSKREVDILNSLDDIINRAKSPVVQDLLKKRQSAKIELPSKELGQPKLAAHESKFMELVGKNRSQADKQAGYPEERRKVEAETGVKIPKEKVNDILSGKSSKVPTSKPDDKGREEKKMKTLAELNKELDQLGLDQVERHTIIQSHIKQGLVLSPKKPVAVKKKKKTLKQIIAELNKETRSKNQS